MIKVLSIGDLVPKSVFAALDPVAVNSVVDNVATAARNHWIRLAEQDTDFGSHWRFDYIGGIQPIEYPKINTAVISLVGEVPHMLEDGAPQLDMRETLLGPNVKVVGKGERGKHKSKKGDFYRSIPLRHTTPGSEAAPRGKIAGREMGTAYSGHDAVADSKKLGKTIYGAAKKLEATKGGPKQRPVYGERLPASLAPKLKPYHKVDIFAGMIRAETTYEKTVSSQYLTFRTISTAELEGWIRAAIPARQYAESVSEFVENLIPKAVDALLEAE